MRLSLGCPLAFAMTIIAAALPVAAAAQMSSRAAPQGIAPEKVSPGGAPAIAASDQEKHDDAVSDWSQASHSAVRLIAGGRSGDGVYRVGVEIAMRPGFKTYWRVPGDAGVPPSFDWSGSDNMGSIAVRWPAPTRFIDGGVTTIGYSNRVIFPVIVRGADPAKPVTLDLKLDYAVCERICIPAQAAVRFTLPAAEQTSQSAVLDRFRAKTPRIKEPGKLDDRLGLISAAFVNDRGKGAIELAVAQPASAALHDAFLEGPDGWAFGAPQRISTEADKLVLRLPVEERPKNMVGMVPLVLTLTGEPQSVEIRFDVEASPTQATAEPKAP